MLTRYLFTVVKAFIALATHTAAPVIPLVLLALILGLPGVLIVVTAHRFSYVMWMGIYLLSLPIWNFVLPTYAFWHFDDFSWGDTRQTAGEGEGKGGKGGHEADGEFDSSQITMKRWGDFEGERRLLRSQQGSAGGFGSGTSVQRPASNHGFGGGHERKGSQLGYEVTGYHDYP